MPAGKDRPMFPRVYYSFYTISALFPVIPESIVTLMLIKVVFPGIGNVMCHFESSITVILVVPVSKIY